MMDDLISRQEALDHLRKRLIEAESKFNCDAGMVFEDITQNRLKTWLEELPSAQQWIPCKERLPDEDYCTGRGIQHSAEVLATVVNHGADDETFVDMMVTVDGEWKMVHPIDGDNDIADWCEVVAWMPLPEPVAIAATDNASCGRKRRQKKDEIHCDI